MDVIGQNMYIKLFVMILSTDEVKTVKNLNSGSVKLYMSNSHIYLATNVYLYRHQLSNCREITVISIFDLELNAVGALRIYGSVLNQFSMDEYNNYFRVVSTNTMAEAERLNAERRSHNYEPDPICYCVKSDLQYDLLMDRYW